VSLDILNILQLWPPFGGVGTTTPTATSYTMTGPSSGYVGFGSDFLVTLGPGLVGTVTIVPSSPGLTGTFTPSSLVLTNTVRSGTLSFEPDDEGSGSIRVADDAGLADPADLDFTVTTLAPSGGGVNPVHVLKPAPLWRHGRLSDWRRPRG